MKKDWAYLTGMTAGRPILVERVVLEEDGTAIEGQFELPPLARLRSEDQVFVAVFVKAHGSIKQMEKHFGVSYPTIKSRLNRIGDQLDFVEVEEAPARTDVLDRLERGEIGVDAAINELTGREDDG